MRSDAVKKGPGAAPQRSLLRADGLDDEDFDKPFIGIANSWNEIVPGHIHLNEIVEAVKEKDEAVQIEQMDPPLDIKELFLLAVATSIDALAVGITFAFLDTPIVEAITIIGLTTFVIAIIGVYVGNFFGNKYKSKAELVGGLILVLIGVKILLEHLGIL